jgi:signal transduction histidine kinase/CheY-like chemotaxis protein
MDPPDIAQPDRNAHDPRVERLAHELAEAIERQAATSQVLEALGDSSIDIGPVFDTVVRHAVQLCGADAGMLYVPEGDHFRPAVLVGASEEYRRFLQDHPVTPDRGSLVGRVALERRPVQIDDAASDPGYLLQEARALGGFRSIMGVPMLAADRVVGVIALWRTVVEPFDDRTTGVVAAFAAQGAVAIQNVQLVHELQERSGELSRSVEELKALGEVSRAVSSTLDLDQVLTTIVTRAVELSNTDGGSIFELEPPTARFRLRTCFGTSKELVEALQEIEIPVGETFVGRAAAAGEALQAPDLAAEPPDPHVAELLRHGWRSMVAIPLRHEDEIVGALVIRRRRTGRVDADTVALLETFASQSAVAIHNARVFRELQRKSAELEVAGRHKSEFLASMSHELRTPLNAVIGFSDVLLDRMFGDLNERQAEYVRDIRDAGRHLLELINEILDLSKIEAGRMELDLGRVDLEQLLRQGIAMVHERADRHAVALQQSVAPDLGAVTGDELKLKQVVLNLLTNAVKFTPDGGTVSLRATRSGDDVRVEVADTGPGVPEHDRARIFEAFQRGDRGARASAEGTGLGLTLSRRIVELHGGRLWLACPPEGGSVFTVTLPAARDLVTPTASDGSPATRQDAVEVLVIEDDRRSADLLRVYLENAGYAVTIAADGEAGVRAARHRVPAVVLLDLGLPAMDGWEVLAALKGDPVTAETPIVIVSMLDEHGAGFALGAAEYLVKPVSQQELLRALLRWAPVDPRRTVVAIDDDETALALADAALTPAGWSVLTASGGEAGIELVRRASPDIVLLDLLMPGLDGFAVAEHLRADPELAEIPIIVMTAKDLSRADRERLRGSVEHLVPKGSLPHAELARLVERTGRRTLNPPQETA